ncbi:MAG: PHB depolymerase family esterase, partial [Gemmobacter sp.]
MTTPFTRGMAEATALTRDGKIGAATALIRSLLRPASGAAVAPDDGAAIDGTCTRIGESDRAQPEEMQAKPQKARQTAPRQPSRTGLAETLRGIAAGGMPARGPLAAAGPAVPARAAFLTLAHSGAEGRRDYRLYVPANRGTGPMPLVVMLHGCTQTPEDFAIGTGMNALAEAAGILVA